MSVATLSDPDLIFKPFPLLNRRKDSGELDVFEAARYFSGYTEATGGSFNGENFTQNLFKEESKSWRGRPRISLDMTVGTVVPEQSFNGGEKQVKEKKFKQPSSPGGKLASFLNSLFNQAVSKKKKESKSSVQSSKDEGESPGGGRRKRRSSLSNFPSLNTTDSKSMNSSTCSDFRSPLLFVQTPTKNYREFKQKVTLLKHSAKPDILEEKMKKDPTLMEEKLKCRNGVPEKQKKNAIIGNSEKDQKKMNWREKYQAKERKFYDSLSVDEDGGESDSSSDLFELQISNLGRCSSNDLPVYETTKFEKIKRGNLVSTHVYSL